MEASRSIPLRVSAIGIDMLCVRHRNHESKPELQMVMSVITLRQKQMFNYTGRFNVCCCAPRHRRVAPFPSSVHASGCASCTEIKNSISAGSLQRGLAGVRSTQHPASVYCAAQITQLASEQLSTRLTCKKYARMTGPSALKLHEPYLDGDLSL